MFWGREALLVMAWIRDRKKVKQIQLGVENSIACGTFFFFFFPAFIYDHSKTLFLIAACPLKAFCGQLSPTSLSAVNTAFGETDSSLCLKFAAQPTPKHQALKKKCEEK